MMNTLVDFPITGASPLLMNGIFPHRQIYVASWRLTDNWQDSRGGGKAERLNYGEAPAEVLGQGRSSFRCRIVGAGQGALHSTF